MTAEADFTNANSLYVGDQFEEAQKLYDSAIEKAGASAPASYFLHRCANQIKLKQYIGARAWSRLRGLPCMR